MDIISRKDAKEQGLKYFDTYKICKYGHQSKRYVSTGGCVQCHEKTYKENKEKYIKSSRKWRNKNKEKYLEINNKSSLKWSKNNKDKVNNRNAKRKAAKLQRTPAWADQQKIKYNYSLAKYFEFITLGIKYHVDHIVPLQGKNVCGLHVSDNLQVLRSDHNHSKNNKWNWDTQSYE
jgi:hypothetical protein